jgi:hypothetical protein
MRHGTWLHGNLAPQLLFCCSPYEWVWRCKLVPASLLPEPFCAATWGWGGSQDEHRSGSWDLPSVLSEMAERHDTKQVLQLARDLVYKVQTLIENK